MPTPGIADPYWFEWYVGLESIIKLLNPDNDIDYVIFQCEEYNTIDDIVVGYKNGLKEICYQVKHEIASSKKSNLTFGKLLEKQKDDTQCLISALAKGWKGALDSSEHNIVPVLFTNRTIGKNRSKRTFDGNQYTAYPLEKYFALLQEVLKDDFNTDCFYFEDNDLQSQWCEMCSKIDISDIPVVAEFIKSFRLSGNQLDLESAEHKLITAVAQTFACSESLASELFLKLVSELRIWTTTRRKNEKVTIETVYSVLGMEADVDSSQHRLAPPHPFFQSRYTFCTQLEQTIRHTEKRVVFVSGEPGSGKTSVISHLHAESNLFLLRYHTFKPISPEQHFYNLDEGMCSPDNLWSTMLVQLRRHFRGKLAQYKVPINNQLCTTEEMRNQVLRLLAIMGNEALQNGQKLFVCIDGIDHAARANNRLSFLSSLFLPEEIPDGICFVIVGQPAEMYHSQYPSWLATGNSVERIELPKLIVDDIKQLITNRVPQFADESESISNLVFQHTKGNNLSTVFAVETICSLSSLQDVATKLEHSGICADVNQYYQHLWTFVKQELAGIGLGIPYPESIIACPILLLNGRVDTRILSHALPYQLSQADWCLIFDKLYPLIVPCDSSGQYALFHNDFRVFLMGITSGYQAKYKEIALQLAEYLHHNDEGILTYVNSIPLLCCAERKDLIPSYFTADFVIGALSEGVSKLRLDEYAQLSYDEACCTQNETLFRNIYLSIKTLHQHDQYYEYYGRNYISADYPELYSIDISEIRTVPLVKENADEYLQVLKLCLKLNSSSNPEFISRSIALYHRWFENLAPTTFASLCDTGITEDEAWKLRKSDVGLLLQQWGITVANMKQAFPNVCESTSQKELVAHISFGDAYFEACFEMGEYSSALEALTKSYVSRDCFEKKLETILYKKLDKLFSPYLSRVSEKAEGLLTRLFASAILAVGNFEVPFLQDLTFDSEPIKHIYDESSFSIILYAFLIGCRDCISDEVVVCSHAKAAYEALESNEQEVEQITKMVRLACLIGKYHMQSTSTPSEALKHHVKWFLTTKLWRRFDYTKAHKFLLFAILNTKACETMNLHSDLISYLETSLFEIDALGMYYKIHILDFLERHKSYLTIEKYILCLYGKDGNRIFNNENYAEMHTMFRPYGEIVLPKIMSTVSDKLKWDVVSYTGDNEYAMQVPSECFETLASLDPSVWNDCGQRLYRQSLIADISNNKYAYDIQKNITKAAIQSGLSDFWKLHSWDEDFKMNSDLLYHSMFEMIETAKTSEDLISIWMINCGIHSWYTQGGRIGSKCIFEACKEKALTMNIDFVGLISDLTPEWLTIVQHESRVSDYQPQVDSYSQTISNEKEAIRVEYESLDIELLLQELPIIVGLSHVEERLSLIIEKLKAGNLLNYENGKKLLLSFSDYLRGKSWSYYGFYDLIKTLLVLLREEAFWTFAEIIGENLSEYNYQTSMRNAQLLLGLYYDTDLNKVRDLFEAELSTQNKWVTGNNHISIDDELLPISNRMPTPISYSELALYLLIEQIQSQNGRKIESAIYSIFKLAKKFPAIPKSVASCWSILSEFQKEMLLIVISRWCIEKIGELDDLYSVLLHEYSACNALNQKYYLDSILKLYNSESREFEGIEYSAPSIEYQLPAVGTISSPGFSNSFLDFTECWCGFPNMNDDIRRYISQNSMESTYIEDRFSKRGDCTIPNSNMKINQVLYGIEKNGRWSDIPIILKKSWLLQADDPFMLTEIPAVVYDDEWFPEIAHSAKDSGTFQALSKELLSQIAHRNCSSSEKVLGACIWYPWDHDDGVIYHEIAKVDAGGLSLTRSSDVEWCMGNFGLLSQEGHIDEIGSNSAHKHGISLFKKVGGGMSFYHGNCQIAPSDIWREVFECTPQYGFPYQWVDASDKTVLRFERITSPTREAMHENYYRQPILFRWICDADWLQDTLSAIGLRIRYVSDIQKLP